MEREAPAAAPAGWERPERTPGAELLGSLLVAKGTRATAPGAGGLVLGELVGLAGGGQIPLVTFPGQPGTSALPARTVVDLTAEHIGASVTLLFEVNDLTRPVIVGRLRDRLGGSPLPATPGHVEVEADGQRLTISAKDQVVLRCGKASITLTRAGKVLIEGTYVLSRSSGANRIKGGSVQIN